MKKKLVILGIRGIPAQHGGFETFAEYLCRYLVKKGWNVTVYCQEIGNDSIYETEWNDIQRIHLPICIKGSAGTVFFDLKAIIHSLNHQGIFLTLGYNTAIFNFLFRIKGKYNLINMDGIEWKRSKWGLLVKAWFWINERLGCWFSNHLIADHPCIEDHLATRVSRKKITMIPYGGKKVVDPSSAIIDEIGLKANGYALVVARPEPENSVLEIVEAFSSKKRNAILLVLGDYFPEDNAYHRKVMNAASDEVRFPGAIYDSDKVGALRFFARVYVHGHKVGGTNPSLVEALGAGSAVLAHDNKFNRWVAKDASLYFSDIKTAEIAFDKLFQSDELVSRLKKASSINHNNNFQWESILKKYEELLIKSLERTPRL